MTAPHPGEPVRLERPACTPAAIRTVLAANADSDTLRRYDADLDTAFEQARATGDLALCSTPSAAGGSKPTPGATPPPAASTRHASAATAPTAHHPRGGGSAALRSASGTASDAKFRWELDEPAEREFAGLGQAARNYLAEFMDAAVIVDPTEYQLRPGEPVGALRTLPFGPYGQGLVTFLIYPPDDSSS